MTFLARRIFPALAVAMAPLAALADPAPPVTSPGIEIVDFGIYCAIDSSGTEPAPETSLGYIRNLSGKPTIVFHQQEVPARLGVHFGVIVRSDRDISQARNLTWIPGHAQPEVWYADFSAVDSKARGFLFERPEELVTGIWRMEAFEGETLLYSIEWEVLPAEALPGIGSNCDFLS